ncbi:MAG TPA: PAS domain S-box protein, partial [Blastocatellia bacterium]|nr:PAS domain S-box protein [Blastocatellia bacterium]
LSRELKSAPTTSHIPIVVVVAEPGLPRLMREEAPVADDYFEIGYPVDLLLRKIRMFVDFNKERTTRQSAEAALLSSEEQYRLLFQANPMPMWVFDLDTLAFLAVNEAARMQYGYTEEEFLAMTISDIRPAEDVAHLVRVVAASSGSLIRGHTVRHRTKDGRTIRVEVSSNDIPFQGRRARLVSASDVTERERAIAALRESEERFSKTFILNPDPMSIHSVDNGRYVDANESFLKVYGFTREEVVGHTPDELNLIVDQQERQEWRRILLSGQSIHEREIQFRVKSGELRAGLLSAVIIEVAGSKCILSVSVDITERQRLQEQLVQAQRMEALGTLASGIAHDFNNLLTAIVGYSQMVQQAAKDNNKLSGYAGEINRAGLRAASLTKQLLAFSRRQIFELQALDLNLMIREMQPMLRRLIIEDVELRFGLDPSLGAIKADRSQIEQVILNLVVNARDAMPGGGVLTVETCNADLGAGYVSTHSDVMCGRFVMLAVSDTGKGMDKETRDRVFEPFFTTKPLGEGTGLGLATTHGIVKQSGGNILVYSEPGYGTVFKVYFPRVDDAPESEPARVYGEMRGGPETILVVEDEDLVRNFARDVLRNAGYNVLECENGAEAHALCLSHTGPIDLVLTDAVMPQMSGAELVSNLSVARPAIRVLFMSGYTGDSLTKGLDGQALAFLQKPFAPDSLLRKVRSVLDDPNRNSI